MVALSPSLVLCSLLGRGLEWVPLISFLLQANRRIRLPRLTGAWSLITRSSWDNTPLVLSAQETKGPCLSSAGLTRKLNSSSQQAGHLPNNGCHTLKKKVLVVHQPRNLQTYTQGLGKGTANDSLREGKQTLQARPFFLSAVCLWTQGSMCLCSHTLGVTMHQPPHQDGQREA